jgi:uncharacterized membrane protein
VYFVRKESPFIRFHAKQAMVLFALSIVTWFLPVFGQLLELLVFAAAVYGFVLAAHGEWKDVPFIGPLSRWELSGMRKSWKEFLDLVVRMTRHFRKHSAPTKAASTPNDSTPPPSQPHP